MVKKTNNYFNYNMFTNEIRELPIVIHETNKRNRFTQAPSYGNQNVVFYKGQKYLQVLSPTQGPFMFPID